MGNWGTENFDNLLYSRYYETHELVSITSRNEKKKTLWTCKDKKKKEANS